MYRLFGASFFMPFMIKEKERRIYQSCEWDVVFKKGFLTQCGNNGNYERKRLQPAQSILKAPLTAPKADNKASPCWPMRQSVQQEDWNERPYAEKENWYELDHYTKAHEACDIIISSLKRRF